MDGMTVAAFDQDGGDFEADLAGHAAEADRTGAFPWESLDALHREGLLGLTARPEDGGEGAGLTRAADLVRRAGQGCASTALIFAMQLTHVRAASGPSWPEHLRARVGRGAGRYGALINALRVEPALGTPARGGLPATAARRVPEGWSISGRKIISTGAPGLTWMLVFAAAHGHPDEPPRTGLFLVPANAPGVRIEETWNQLGLRASGSHDVVFEQVIVPADHAVDLRSPADWARPDPVGAAWSALPIAALYTGVAEAARDWGVHFLKTRAPANLGAPLATLPRMHEAVGRIDSLLLTNRRLVACAAADTDAGRPPSPTESGLLKTVAAENAIEAVQDAMRLAGTHALARANPLERHLRDVLCARVHTPQPDAAYAAAGRAALGQ
jgi:alkylation response protein AidB-like acyl-CoA dehydrogenase